LRCYCFLDCIARTGPALAAARLLALRVAYSKEIAWLYFPDNCPLF